MSSLLGKRARDPLSSPAADSRTAQKRKESHDDVKVDGARAEVEQRKRLKDLRDARDRKRRELETEALLEALRDGRELNGDHPIAWSSQNYIASPYFRHGDSEDPERDLFGIPAHELHPTPDQRQLLIQISRLPPVSHLSPTPVPPQTTPGISLSNPTTPPSPRSHPQILSLPLVESLEPVRLGLISATGLLDSSQLTSQHGHALDPISALTLSRSKGKVSHLLFSPNGRHLLVVTKYEEKVANANGLSERKVGSQEEELIRKAESSLGVVHALRMTVLRQGVLGNTIGVVGGMDRCDPDDPEGWHVQWDSLIDADLVPAHASPGGEQPAKARRAATSVVKARWMGEGRKWFTEDADVKPEFGMNSDETKPRKKRLKREAKRGCDALTGRGLAFMAVLDNTELLFVHLPALSEKPIILRTPLTVSSAVSSGSGSLIAQMPANNNPQAVMEQIAMLAHASGSSHEAAAAAAAATAMGMNMNVGLTGLDPHRTSTSMGLGLPDGLTGLPTGMSPAAIMGGVTGLTPAPTGLTPAASGGLTAGFTPAGIDIENERGMGNREVGKAKAISLAALGFPISDSTVLVAFKTRPLATSGHDLAPMAADTQLYSNMTSADADVDGESSNPFSRYSGIHRDSLTYEDLDMTLEDIDRLDSESAAKLFGESEDGEGIRPGNVREDDEKGESGLDGEVSLRESGWRKRRELRVCEETEGIIEWAEVTIDGDDASNGIALSVRALGPIHFHDQFGEGAGEDRLSLASRDLTGIEFVETPTPATALEKPASSLCLTAVFQSCKGSSPSPLLCRWSIAQERFDVAEAFINLDGRKGDVPSSGEHTDWVAFRPSIRKMDTRPIVSLMASADLLHVVQGDEGHFNIVEVDEDTLDSRQVASLVQVQSNGARPALAFSPNCTLACLLSASRNDLLRGSILPMTVSSTASSASVAGDLSACLAKSIMNGRDVNDILRAGPKRGLSTSDVPNMLLFTWETVESSLGQRGSIETTQLLPTLLGVLLATQRSDSAFGAREQIQVSMTVLQLIACREAFRVCRNAPERIGHSAAFFSPDSIWPLIGYSSWYIRTCEDLVRSITAQNSRTRSMYTLILLHPLPRTLLSQILDLVQELRTFLSSKTGLSVSNDLARNVFKDLVDLGALDIEEWQRCLHAVGGLAISLPGDVLAASLRLSLATSQLAPGLEEMAASVEGILRQRKPCSPNASSGKPPSTFYEVDILKKASISAAHSPTWQCLRCSGLLQLGLPAPGHRRFDAFEGQLDKKCFCGGLWSKVDPGNSARCK